MYGEGSNTYGTVFRKELKSYDIQRVGEGKFFGFGVCQRANIKLIDINNSKTVTTSNYFKIGFDVTCLVITACMTFFCLGHIMGLGIGTIVAAFTMGKGIAIIGNWMDQRVEFVSLLS